MKSKYDLILKNGWVIDPSTSLYGRYDIGLYDDRIAAIENYIPFHEAKQVLDVSDLLVCPGFIDLHTHVYEWISDFGLCADDVGIHAGVTTVVDQGSCGSRTFHDFKTRIVEKARTQVFSFPLVNQAKVQKAGNGIADLMPPDLVDLDAIINLAKDEREIVKGFKVIEESGTVSRWDMDTIKLGRKVGDLTGLPLYVHTGELFPVIETNRPAPDEVIKNTLSFVKPGDILAHCYSHQADGILGNRSTVPPQLVEALNDGVLLDLGHGLQFSFEVARCMMSQGILPFTISSDVHGDLNTPHNNSTLDYSLCGSLSKLIALGMDLEAAIASVTCNPASILRAELEIGTLRVGSRADITILNLVKEDWLCHDSLGEQLVAKLKLVPAWVVRLGKLIKPHCRLLRDLHITHQDRLLSKAS